MHLAQDSDNDYISEILACWRMGMWSKKVDKALLALVHVTTSLNTNF